MADKTEELNALEQIMIEGKLARDEGQKAYAQDLIGEFIDSVVESGTDVSSDTVASINQKIAEIDALITEQLNEVMHQPDFQKLEASWRGLHFLVMGTETGTQLKLRVLNTSSKDLLADLEKAVEFDQSALFKMIYEEEYGTFGGHPYSCLMADFEFGRHPQQFALMEKLAEVAAAAHAPMIASASPRMFDMDSFIDLGTPRDLSKIFESAEMVKWRSFRDSDDSRYMVLTLPHTLMRLPYGPNTVPVEGIDFAEDVDGRDHSKYLWGSAAWAMAQRITNAFSMYGWTAAIRGVEGGGVVKGLPTHTFKTDEGDIALKCPTEIAITDRREKELSDLGFIALCHCKGTDYAAFFGGQTVQKPKKYNLDSANANAALSARLPYIMAASRFAHYMKAIMRDKVGSFLTAANVEEYLNTWIANYVLLTDDAPQNTKARFPLREARVDVREIPGKPGAYNATVFLKPHFQLEELTASVRLVAELPPPAA
ncbi:MAG TPA: type VI secretion system contractile sheath large subunit [Rhodospirillaceae bacterium]|nr:type VI secretion system contractile sheath large subunit [Rhodospirillaceae bacterium]MAX62951.1 type VI secretion system contractile sheath large subunit [Rhodospirillaceae bacterium]MBB57798.1 type VI secretion system contractile sheath large subunit [Rhodospirillaceae bacterium]HBM13498.1 type VI secretion system contractile sheath large subunit [Rhodospirillaceae bacterium]|tara:strand:+ start:12320 stop:13771 length:1452 start_codon:yes stop_codon:yes gene_type:complete